MADLKILIHWLSFLMSDRDTLRLLYLSHLIVISPLSGGTTCFYVPGIPLQLQRVKCKAIAVQGADSCKYWFDV